MPKSNSSPAPRISFTEPTGLVDGDVENLEPHESREGERFEGGDLAGVDLSGIALMECVLESVTLTDTGLRGGKIDFLNLRGANLTDVLIEGAQITELDLSGFSGTRVAIHNCRIDTLDLTRATCVDVDLRDSSISRVVGVEGMRGTILNEVQLAEFAPILAGLIGIRIE